MDEKIICVACGGENPATAKFCMACGEKLALPETAPMAEAALVVEEAASLAVAPSAMEEASPKRVTYTRVMSLVRGGVCLLLSLVLLILSFMPVMTYRIDMNELTVGEIKGEASLRFSVIDNLCFFFDSFYQYDEDDIVESELYERLTDATEAMAEEAEDLDKGDELSAEGKRYFREIVMTTARLGMRSEDVSLPVAIAVSAALTLTYVIVALVLFIFSLIHLTRLFIRESDLEGKVVRLICFMPFLIIFAHFATRVSLAGIELVAGKASMGAAAVGIVACALAIAFFITERIVSAVRSRTFRLRRTIVNGVTVALAVLTVCMLFTPVINTRLTAVFDGRESEKTVSAPVGVEGFLFLDISREEMDEKLDEMGESKATKYEYLMERMRYVSYYTVKEVRDGAADGFVMDFLADTFVALVGEYGKPMLITPYVFLLSALFVALVAKKSLSYLCLGRRKRTGTAITALWCFFTACAVGLVVAYVVCLNVRIDMLYYSDKPALEDMLSVGIGIGSVLFPLCGLLTFISRLFEKKKSEKKG